MALKNYLIAPLNSGIQNNIEPWLLPEDAFQFMTNAYTWRGRIKKRFGYSYLGDTDLDSRLRINLGVIPGGGTLAGNVPGVTYEVGQLFSVGTDQLTVNVAGAPATLLTTGTSTGTFNTTTGAYSITGTIGTAVYFYPATPVMGLRSRENISVNVEDTIGFDTQFSYMRVAGAWELLGALPVAAGYAQWSSTNSDFFWTTNYRSSQAYTTAFWVVNNRPYVAGPPITDGLKYIDESSATWVSLRPQLDVGATRFLETSLIVVGFRDRLVVLNTLEDEGGSDRRYQNRARFSQNGDPTVAATSWLDDSIGVGGYIDAATQEAIVSVEFIKGHLIVYFERSTWELVYNASASIPFTWQQLNNELGSESPFSIIGFDRTAVGVGNVGIHSCNGVNVERIDQKIPDEVFRIHNGNDGVERVYGIRDYYRELVYWTFPAAVGDPTFPTKILVWNYQNDSWAFFEDSFTCFGYFQKDADLSWTGAGLIYGTWAAWDAPWGGARAQSQFPEILAGNQQGFTVLLNGDKAFNGPALYITDMTVGTQQMTIINHNLTTGDFLEIVDPQGVTLSAITTFKLVVVDANTISIDNTDTTTPFSWTGTYRGGGKLTRISNLDITSKQWNPGTPVGQQFRIPYIDFLLDRTADGEVSVDYLVDSTLDWTIQEQDLSDVLLGSNTLYTKPEDNSPYQINQVRIWHRYFMQTQGMMIQIKIFMTDDQMRDLDISRSDFQIDAILLYIEPSGRITG